jgi:hypothetical protein
LGGQAVPAFAHFLANGDQVHVVAHHAGRDDHQQLGASLVFAVGTKEFAQQGDVLQQGNAGFAVGAVVGAATCVSRIDTGCTTSPRASTASN